MEYSGAGGNWFMKKTRSKKSRDTVPLKTYKGDMWILSSWLGWMEPAVKGLYYMSTRVSVQSSELGPLTPSPASECVSSRPSGSGGGGGCGETQFRRLVFYIV